MARRSAAAVQRGRASTAARRGAAGVDLDDAGFRRGLDKWWNTIRAQKPRDLDRLGLRVQNEARKLAPVDTGRLRSSIVKGPLMQDGKGFYVDVVVGVDYASFVEFGTSRSPAQPFLRPAYILAGQWWAQMARGS